MEATETTPDDRYETIEGHLERDRETVLGLWRGNIGWQDQLDRMYDVFYLNCPYEKPLLQLLRHRASNEIVGTVGMGARAVLWRGSEQVVGCASWSLMRVLHRPGPVGRASMLVVSEAARRKGVGKALMAAVEAKCFSLGCVLVEVTSNLRRADAHKFYEALGYDKTSYRFGKTP